jgi:hypothetical protein
MQKPLLLNLMLLDVLIKRGIYPIQPERAAKFN